MRYTNEISINHTVYTLLFSDLTILYNNFTFPPTPADTVSPPSHTNPSPRCRPPQCKVQKLQKDGVHVQVEKSAVKGFIPRMLMSDVQALKKPELLFPAGKQLKCRVSDTGGFHYRTVKFSRWACSISGCTISSIYIYNYNRYYNYKLELLNPAGHCLFN